MTGLDWRLRGNCTVRAAEAFFPLSYGTAATKPAKAMCDGCPVATICLKWAVDTGEPEGIYGGRTAAERKKYGTGPMPEPAAPKKPGPRGPFKPNCRCGLLKTKARSGGRDRWICQPCDAARTRRFRASREQVSA